MIKSKVFKSKYSDMEIVVLDNGWTLISQGEESISLGNYPNKRFELLEQGIEYAKKLNEKLRKKNV